MSLTVSHTAFRFFSFVSLVKALPAFLLFVIAFGSFAQNTEPTFVKVIGSDSLPLAGVTLTWFQSGESANTQYAITDVTGKATLQLSARATITATYIGYESQRVNIFPGDNISFAMQRVFNNLDAVVVTGQLDATKPQQSAENVKVIDRNTIERVQARNVRDLLQQQMEVRIAEDNMLGSTLTMHGLSGNNVKVMIDGVPVIGRENGNVDLGQIPLNNVEQVEIVEGPMSVLYSTDAVAGVINLVTRRNSGGKNMLQLNLNGEAPRSLYADGTAWWQLKKSHLTLSAGRHYFDGYPKFDTTRFQQWKPSLKHFANLGYGWKTNKSSTELKADYFTQTTLDRGKPVTTPYEAYAFDKRYVTERLGVSAFFNYDLTKSLRLDHTVAGNLYSRSLNTYRKDLTSLNNELLSGEGTTTKTDIVHAMYRLLLQQPNVQHKMRFQTGLEVNWEKGSGDKILPDTKPIVEYAAIGQLEFRPTTNLLLKPGLRVNYNTTYKAPVIPSLNMRWQITPTVSMRAGAARGYRAPSMKELYLNFVDLNHDIHGNPDLKSETSWNGTGSLQLSRRFETVSIALDYDVYYHNIDNQIILANTDTSMLRYMYLNIDKTVTMGTDFKTTFTSKAVLASGGMAFTGVDNVSLTNNTAWSPEFFANATWLWNKTGLSFTALYRNIGASPQYAVDENGLVERFITEGYALVDLLATKTMFNKRLVFNAGVKNLTNVTNVQSSMLSGVHTSGSELSVARGRYVTAGITLNLYKDTKNNIQNDDR